MAILPNGAWSAADAQRQPGTTMQLGGVTLALSPDEMRALSNLGNLVRSGQKGFQDRALAEARRVARGRDARHVLALYELEIGGRRGDDAMRARALDVLIDSSITERDKLPGYVKVRAQIASRAGDLDVADRHWARLAALRPSDPDISANLAQVRLARKDAPGAMASMAQAITAREALGPRAPEAWYRQRLAIAQQGSLVTPGIDAARALVSAYPTAANWRDALLVYRKLVAPEGALEIDLLRLMRHVGALAQGDEYLRLAQLLRLSGEPDEAKAVLDEALKRGLVDAGTSPTRDIVAEVDWAIAEGRSGTVPKAGRPDEAGEQVRLGRSRLLAGRRAEAEAAFRSAAADPAGGRYADLALFWLASLAR